MATTKNQNAQPTTKSGVKEVKGGLASLFFSDGKTDGWSVGLRNLSLHEAMYLLRNDGVLLESVKGKTLRVTGPFAGDGFYTITSKGLLSAGKDESFETTVDVNGGTNDVVSLFVRPDDAASSCGARFVVIAYSVKDESTPEILVKIDRKFKLPAFDEEPKRVLTAKTRELLEHLRSISIDNPAVYELLDELRRSQD